MAEDSGVAVASAPECWAAPSGFDSGTGWSYHTGLWNTQGELVLTVRTSLSMENFDPRDLRLHAWVESADAGRRRHFRSRAMSGGLHDFVSVWVSPADESFPLADGDRLVIESEPDGISFAQDVHQPAPTNAELSDHPTNDGRFDCRSGEGSCEEVLQAVSDNVS